MSLPGSIKTIGVIGAGLMGNGIAHASLVAGYDVILVDVFEGAIPKAVATMTKNMDRQVAKNTLAAADKDAALARLKTSGEYSSLAAADFIIEAVPELLHVKKEIYETLKPIVKPETILASNTSSISITKLAALTGRPDKFIGMHFFNPVPMMKLVELIRGLATAEATYKTAHEVATKLGKTVATAEDSPAFIVNRILCPMLNEAIFTLAEGTGDVASIDAGMKLGANHPMGPLELSDFVGLDTLLSVLRVMHEGLGEDKYRPSPLLVKYVEAGWYGRKSGKGFYDYSTTPPTPTR